MLEWLTDTFLRLVASGDTYIFLLPIFVALVLGERLACALTRARYDDRDAGANIAVTVAVLAIDTLVGAVLPLALLAWLYEHARLFTLGDGARAWLLAFLLHDLVWYVDHRISHRVGLFWAMHHVHHSSSEYNATVASRAFILDNVMARPLFYALPVLGVSPFQFIAVRIVVSVWGIAQHTRLVPKLPVLDWLLATPSSHRVHHGSDPKYIDRNYGEVLMIWDQLFGSYQPEEEEPNYGVTEPINTYNPLAIELAGFRGLARRVRAATRWRDKLAYLVMPPEWRHDRDAPVGRE